MIDAKKIIDSAVEVTVDEWEEQRIGREFYLQSAACIAVIVSALLSIILMLTGRMSIIGMGLPFFALLYAALFGIIFWRKRIQKRWLGVLFESCNPYFFMEETYIRLSLISERQRKSKKNGRLGNCIYLYYFANALRYQDEKNWELAYRLMSQLEDCCLKGKGAVIYHQFMGTCAYYREDEEELERQAQLLAQACEGQKEKIKRGWLEGIQNNQKLLRMKRRGDLEGCCQLTEEMLRSAKHKLERVCLQFRLGELAAELGDREKARKHFQYVEENGNRLYIVEKARGYLEKLDLETE